MTSILSRFGFFNPLNLATLHSLFVPTFYGGSAPKPMSSVEQGWLQEKNIEALATAADKQNKWNRDASVFEAAQNRYRQVGPTGEVNWLNQGSWENPKWTQTTTLSPEQKKLYDSQQGQQVRASGGADILMNQLGSLSPMNERPYIRRDDRSRGLIDSSALSTARVSGVGDMAQRQRAEEAIMGRLNPQLDRDQKELENKLANQGLIPGSRAYTNAMADMSTRVNDARLGAIAQGGQEMANASAIERAAAESNFGQETTARQQRLSEYGQLHGMDTAADMADAEAKNSQRSRLLAEISALQQMSGKVNVPGADPSVLGGPGVADLAGMVSNSQQQLLSSQLAPRAAPNNKNRDAAIGAGTKLGGKVAGDVASNYISGKV